MLAIYTYLVGKSHFPVIENNQLELRKAAMLRIFLGVFIFIRCAEIAHSIYIYYGPSLLLWQSFWILTLIFFFTVGLFTPISTLLLLASIRWFDSLTTTGNLGSIILVHLLIILILINHGFYYSADRQIMKRGGIFSRVLKAMYNVIGTPSASDIRNAYFLGFILYGLISFGAVLHHVDDQYWTAGVTIKSLLTNSYLCKYYSFFRWLEDTFPLIFGVISATGGVFQTVFQVLMIPLMFFKIGRKFVLVWGLGFILISLIFINLSYLPVIELIIWVLIFFPLRQGRQLHVEYNPSNPVHVSVVAFLQKINFNLRYVFSKQPDCEVLSGVLALKNNPSSTMTGTTLALKIVQMNPLLWALVPIIYLLRVLKFDFAKNQWLTRWLRSPVNTPVVIDREQSVFLGSSYSRIFAHLFYTPFMLILVLYSLLEFPYLGPKVLPVFGDSPFPNTFRTYSHKIGLQIPDVFNRQDLAMGDHWMVMYRNTNNGLDLVPITDTDGSRLNYVGFDVMNYTNHNSDFLYFGCTLQYSRNVLYTNDITQFHEDPSQYGYQNIAMRIKYDYQNLAFQEPVEYWIKVFASRSSETSLWSGDKSRHKPTLLYSKKYRFDGHSLSVIDQSPPSQP
jgi:hypothetical protein